MKLIDLTGRRFERLLVLRRDKSRRARFVYWLCRCDCGATISVSGQSLRYSVTHSCGCLRSERTTATNHARAKAPDPRRIERRTWYGMIVRCTNPQHRAFARYGGRGISVCKRWLSFEKFFADMGARPSRDHSLERINNDGPYDPKNCRWATRVEQNNNRRSNHLLSAFGETATIAQWAAATGINYYRIASRIDQGWDAERALTTAVRPWTAQKESSL